MQQTEKYQFNLIEGGDDFSPEPLNQNTQRAEALLAGRARIISGSYTGTGQYGADNPTILEFPDTERPPAVIFVSDTNGSLKGALIRGMTSCNLYRDSVLSYTATLTWTDKGVRMHGRDGAHVQLNTKNDIYYYVALI